MVAADCNRVAIKTGRPALLSGSQRNAKLIELGLYRTRRSCLMLLDTGTDGNGSAVSRGQ